MPSSRENLRDRIHRIFSSDCTGTAVQGTLPTFWTPPPDGTTCEPFDPPPNPAGITEEKWLNAPNPVFGWKSPKDILDSGSNRDLEKLKNAICAFEEGAFS